MTKRYNHAGDLTVLIVRGKEVKITNKIKRLSRRLDVFEDECQKARDKFDKAIGWR